MNRNTWRSEKGFTDRVSGVLLLRVHRLLPVNDCLVHIDISHVESFWVPLLEWGIIGRGVLLKAVQLLLSHAISAAVPHTTC